MVLPFGESSDPISPEAVDDPADRQDVADYIARLSGELRQIAAAADLELLAYLLGMAEREADMMARDLDRSAPRDASS